MLKRVLKILGWSAVAIILVMVLVTTVLSIPAVQTWLVGKVSNTMSEALGNEITIESVSINPLRRVDINSVYIEDQEGDTLLYIPQVRARFSLVHLLFNKIQVRRAELIEPYVNIKVDSCGRHNYDFITSRFASQDSEKEPFRMHVEVGKAAISNGRLAFKKELTAEEQKSDRRAKASDDRVFDATDFVFTDINIEMALNELKPGSIDGELEHLSLRERSGFELNNFQAHIIFDSLQLYIPTLRLEMPNTFVDVSVLRATLPRGDSSAIDLGRSQVDFILDRGTVVLSDIGAFMPAVRYVNKPLHLSAAVNGTVSNLTLSNLQLDYNDYELLDGNVSVIGLPQFDTTTFCANVNKFSINAAVLQDFLSSMNRRPYVLPPLLSRLGEIRYKGFAKGNVNDMELRGGFSSAVGSISTIGSLRTVVRMRSDSVTHKRDFYFDGNISTHKFRLGKLLAQERMGDIDFALHANGKLDTLSRLGVTADGGVGSFEYNGYTYHDLIINGRYEDNSFSGEMSMHDPHLWFDFDGLVDLNEGDPKFDFELQIDSLHPGKLHLVEGKYADTKLRLRSNIHLQGNTIDNINGFANIDSVYLYNSGSSIVIPRISLSAQNGDKDEDWLELNSDYLNASVKGNYTYSKMPLTIEKLCARYLPNFFSDEHRARLAKTKTNNVLDINIKTHNLDVLTELLALDIHLANDVVINGKINEEQNNINLSASVPSFDRGNMRLRDVVFNVNNEMDTARLALSLRKLHKSKKASVYMGDLWASLNMKAINDSVLTDLAFNNDSVNQITGGRLSVLTHFHSKDGAPLIIAEGRRSQMSLLSIPWQMEPMKVTYSVADTSVEIDDFKIQTLTTNEQGEADQHLFIHGKGSKSVNDTLFVDFKDVGLDWLVGLSGFYGIDFDGRITGPAMVYNTFTQPMIEAGLRMRDFGMNDVHIGHAVAQAEWQRDSVALHYFGDVYDDEDNHHVAHLDGAWRPKRKGWNLGIDSEGVPLDFVSKWTNKVFGKLGGEIYGRVDIDGDTTGVEVSAAAMIYEGYLGVNVIGTTYYFEDTIHLVTTSVNDTIVLHNMAFRDAENHEVRVDGNVVHSNFTNFRYNIAVDSKGAQVMNLPRSVDNSMYGKVYADGQVSLVGNQRYCNIDISARTRQNSNFGLSLNRTSTAVDNDYITFVDHRKPVITQERPSRNAFRMQLGLNIDVTPDALITLDIDKRTGDAIQARGEGNVSVGYQTPSKEVNLRGQVNISNGSVGYTISNIIRKKFEIEPGGTVVFNGSPTATQLDLRADYQTTASLRDLLGDQFQQAGLKRSYVPVTCVISIGGRLNSPEIGYDIQLPNSDETARQQVESIINTEEMKMREILYLLAFNKFYTPDYLQSSGSNDGASESISLLSSTVTGQLNNWISKISRDFQLGFNVHTSGAGSDMSQEYEGQFMYQPINNLEINGNFGYRYNDISNRPFFGDIDIEYLLTESGKYRIKGYTHSVDKYSLKQASTIQGVGFVYKNNFADIYELFHISRKDTVPPSTKADSVPADSLNVSADSTLNVKK